MRSLAAMLSIVVLVACSSGPVPRGRSQTATSSRVSASAPTTASTVPPVEFLLTKAAADFRTHRPPYPERVRDVRVGHVVNPEGRTQYVLCGQFLPAKDGNEAEWIPFVTIKTFGVVTKKTGGYEQWIGGQAAGLCQGSSVSWENEGDLSSSLQARLDSLR